MDLAHYLKTKAALIESALDRHLPAETQPPALIHKAMRYSVFSNGKRLRPILTIATGEMYDVPEEVIMPAACAIELIHTYSLVHDDLPCMDDDEFRRGRLTSHRVFGEGIAVLAGDALLTHAFQLLASTPVSEATSATTIIRLIVEIAAAAGTGGMIGGQVADLLAEGRKLDLSQLRSIHDNKTGALFKASIRAGALLGNAPPDELESLTAFAANFGLAFQITDDIIDAKEDGCAKRKVTYPSLLGVAGSREQAKRALDRAIEALRGFGSRAEVLIQLSSFILDREH